jgi:hypothetical protein
MVELQPVDAVEVTLVVDNFVGVLLAGAEGSAGSRWPTTPSTATSWWPSVVVSGCSHAGAVDVLRNARRLTSRRQIVGFVGGCHLTGAVFEPLIEPTIAAVTDLGVERLMPGHCTGWKATHHLAQALPDAFVQPSVGTVLRF